VPIADRHAEYAETLAARLRDAGLRARVDESRETLGKKVRGAQVEKVPYTLVVGDKEVEAGTAAVRDRAGTEARGASIELFLERALEEKTTKALEGMDVSELAAG